MVWERGGSLRRGIVHRRGKIGVPDGGFLFMKGGPRYGSWYDVAPDKKGL